MIVADLDVVCGHTCSIELHEVRHDASDRPGNLVAAAEVAPRRWDVVARRSNLCIDRAARVAASSSKRLDGERRGCHGWDAVKINSANVSIVKSN
jgi:hypothetical protein